MILQKILLPNFNICQEKELYYKGDLEKDNSLVEFNSYFNSFSIEKWKKYTKLENLTLSISCSGIGDINIVNSYLVKDKIKLLKHN